MATIKTIKSKYDLLTKQERFGLYQKASLRRDDNELSAIYAATPMKTFSVIDFYFLREEIYRIDTVNLLSRLGHSAMFETFVRFADDQRKSEQESDYYLNASSLSAYLYVIETDAWQIVCDELGFEVNWFRTLSSQISFAVEMMEKKDELMRDCAFSEDEARAFMKTNVKKYKVKNFHDIKTLDEQIRFYRQVIEEI